MAERRKEAALAFGAAKRTSRQNANLQASFRAKSINANPAIPRALKLQLGLNVPNAPTVTPTGLSVNPFANGINSLSWSSNANKQNTQYVIEAKRSQNGVWQYVDVTTKTKYDHKGQIPGRHVLYRVTARRGDLQSAHSGEAVAYGDDPFGLQEHYFIG